jgi:hypothetical protein
VRLVELFFAPFVNTPFHHNTEMTIDVDDGYVLLKFHPRTVLVGNEEPSRHLHHWTGDVVLGGVNGDAEEIKIGEFSLYYVDLCTVVDEGGSVHDVFDTSGSTYGYLSALYDAPEGGFFHKRVMRLIADEFYEPNLLILDRLTIDPPYRGKQRGLIALLGLIDQFCSGVRVAALKPFPLQHEASAKREDRTDEYRRLELDKFEQDMRKSTAALKRYYARAGFKAVPRTDYMILDLQSRSVTARDLIEPNHSG